MFTESINAIVKVVTGITSQNPKIKTILTVGGYAECELVRGGLRSDIPDIKVIVPKDSGLAVLKGAVLYGHRPQVISARKLRYTYGSSMITRFHEDIHPLSHKFYDEERTLLEVNTSVDASGVVVTKKAYPFYKSMRGMSTMVFRSTKKNPIVADDESCTFVGELFYALPEYKGHGPDDRYVEEIFTFGLSELLVEVFVPGTGEKLESEFQLL